MICVMPLDGDILQEAVRKKAKAGGGFEWRELLNLYLRGGG